MNTYRNHHYVPQWYQYKFLKNLEVKNFHVLDLSPGFLCLPDGSIKRLPDLRALGPRKCFVEKDLYTTFFPHGYSTDIESKFFGNVDLIAPPALDAFLDFTHENFDPDTFNAFMRHLSLQRMRTPKGLMNLQRRLEIKKDNEVLFQMQKLQEIFCAIWSDCVWQIASAENSITKFILSDSPVTLYNQAYRPKSRACMEEGDPAVAQNGTHTIYPLSDEKILILTHATYLRNPWLDPKGLIPNPRPFRESIFSFLDIQLRHLTEHEVTEINYVIKARATRYVAASEKSWLFPENQLCELRWENLGRGDLFMPDPRAHTFTANTFIGYKNGITKGFDSNNLRPGQRGFSMNPSSDELNRFDAFQVFFAERHGRKRRGRAHSFGRLDDEFDSEDYHTYMLKKLPNYISKFGKLPFYK